MERKEFDHEWFISHEFLCVGDYGGAGSVGEANIRALETLEGAFVEHGAYYFRQLWLPDTEDNRSTLGGLDDYAAIDDEIVSEVEADWEKEAWESWLRSDLLRTLDVEVRDVADEMSDDLLWELYTESMSKTNNYPTAEYSGVHIPIDRIKETFGDLVREELLCRTWGEAVAADGPETGGTGILADWCEETGHHLAGVVRYLADQEREEEPASTPSLEG